MICWRHEDDPLSDFRERLWWWFQTWWQGCCLQSPHVPYDFQPPWSIKIIRIPQYLILKYLILKGETALKIWFLLGIFGAQKKRTNLPEGKAIWAMSKRKHKISNDAYFWKIQSTLCLWLVKVKMRAEVVILVNYLISNSLQSLQGD